MWDRPDGDTRGARRNKLARGELGTEKDTGVSGRARMGRVECEEAREDGREIGPGRR